MDAKYLGKSVPLPKEIHTKLEEYRMRLSEELGFKVSLADAIGRLLKEGGYKGDLESAAARLAVEDGAQSCQPSE